MNQNNDATIVRERRVLTTSQKLTIVGSIIIMLLLAGGGYLLSQKYENNQSYGLESYGLDGDLPLDVTTNGYIYVSGYNETFGFNTYALNLDTRAFSEITSSGNNWEFSKIDDSHALFSTSLNGTTEENTQIAIMDFSDDTYLNLETPVGYYKRHLNFFTLNKDALVYSARTEAFMGAEDFYSSSKWVVVYGEPETGEFTTLENSFSPVLLADRNEFVYLKSDGMYVYNFRTKENYVIQTGLNNLNPGSEIAVSEDRTKIIMTLPAESSIIVFDMMADDKISVVETGLLKENNRRFISPVISPDNRFYATFAFTDSSEQINALIEIRSFDSKELIANYVVDIAESNSVRLNDWGSILITETANVHHGEGTVHARSETSN